MNRPTNRFERGSGIYKCRCCTRKTRSTGRGDNELVKLCAECYDLAGEENHLADTGRLYDKPEVVIGMIDAVRHWSGDASMFEALRDAATAQMTAPQPATQQPTQPKETTMTTTSLTLLNAASIVALIDSGSLSKADAAAEFTRRIDKRAAAGKHPMEHIVALRDKLVAEAAKPAKAKRSRKVSMMPSAEDMAALGVAA